MGNHNLPNTRAIKKTGQLLDRVGLPVIKETEATAKDGVATAWRVSKGQPRSNVFEGVAVRLALIAQSQDERQILTQSHFILHERIELMLFERNLGIAEVQRELGRCVLRISGGKTRGSGIRGGHKARKREGAAEIGSVHGPHPFRTESASKAKRMNSAASCSDVLEIGVGVPPV